MTKASVYDVLYNTNYQNFENGAGSLSQFVRRGDLLLGVRYNWRTFSFKTDSHARPH